MMYDTIHTRIAAPLAAAASNTKHAKMAANYKITAHYHFQQSLAIIVNLVQCSPVSLQLSVHLSTSLYSPFAFQLDAVQRFILASLPRPSCSRGRC